jgi:hypothetical protein
VLCAATAVGTEKSWLLESWSDRIEGRGEGKEERKEDEDMVPVVLRARARDRQQTSKQNIYESDEEVQNNAPLWRDFSILLSGYFVVSLDCSFWLFDFRCCSLRFKTKGQRSFVRGS